MQLAGHGQRTVMWLVSSYNMCKDLRRICLKGNINTRWRVVIVLSARVCDRYDKKQKVAACWQQFLCARIYVVSAFRRCVPEGCSISFQGVWIGSVQVGTLRMGACGGSTCL